MNCGAGIPYEKPHVEYWTAAELDSIQATMSGGGIWVGPQDGRYHAYVLVNSVSVGGFGHGALALVKDDNVTVFSFSGDFAGDINTDRSAITSFLTAGISGKMDSYSCSYSSFLSNPSFGPDRYDRGLRMEIREAQYRAMLNEGTRRLYKQTKCYSLLNYNCMDCALDLLSRGGITLSWSTDFQARVMACAESFTAVFSQLCYEMLEAELRRANRGFTIPRSVVDDYTGYSGSVPINGPDKVYF